MVHPFSKIPGNPQHKVPIVSYIHFLIRKSLIAGPQLNLIIALTWIEQSKLLILARTQPQPVNTLATHDRETLNRRILIRIADKQPYPRITKLIQSIDCSDNFVPAWIERLLKMPILACVSIYNDGQTSHWHVDLLNRASFRFRQTRVGLEFRDR
jgi:hypothetical protein